jgi:hypothetical protein
MVNSKTVPLGKKCTEFFFNWAQNIHKTYVKEYPEVPNSARTESSSK